MNKSHHFQALLLVSTGLLVLLLLSFSHGSGDQMMETFTKDASVTAVSMEMINSRKMIQMDYLDAGPNYNYNSGFPFSPTAPPPPPPPPPPPQP